MASRPNILLIICDDLGYGDVGFNGAKDIQTPNIDKLAQGGVVMTSGYVVHPFCGPSRMGLLAGRYPHKFGGPYNLPPAATNFEKYKGQGIPVGETLLSTTLQKAGYHTGAIGKWHLGFAPEFHPNARGFDDFFGFLGGGHMYFPEQYQAIHERQKNAGKTNFNEYQTPLEHNGKEVVETEYMTDALSREAVRFVKESADARKPFFLYLAYNAPHTPLEAKEDDLAKFAAIQDEKRRTYAAMVWAVDRGIGKITEALKGTGAFDNTLIVFLSDNGGKLGAGANNGPLSEGKGSVADGGIRVPMFFHWPAGLEGGRQYDHPVSSLDYYPTFAALAGAEVPYSQKLDGLDILSAVKANQSAREGKAMFALRHFNGFHNVGIRQDRWKATRKGPNSPWELFDITTDLGESKDVSSQYPERVKEMVGAAKVWSQAHIDPLWFDTPNGAKYWKDKNMPDYARTFTFPMKN